MSDGELHGFRADLALARYALVAQRWLDGLASGDRGNAPDVDAALREYRRAERQERKSSARKRPVRF